MASRVLAASTFLDSLKRYIWQTFWYLHTDDPICVFAPKMVVNGGYGDDWERSLLRVHVTAIFILRRGREKFPDNLTIFCILIFGKCGQAGEGKINSQTEEPTIYTTLADRGSHGCVTLSLEKNNRVQRSPGPRVLVRTKIVNFVERKKMFRKCVWMVLQGVRRTPPLPGPTAPSLEVLWRRPLRSLCAMPRGP